jgi:hypothetical protein
MDAYFLGEDLNKYKDQPPKLNQKTKRKKKLYEDKNTEKKKDEESSRAKQVMRCEIQSSQEGLQP